MTCCNATSAAPAPPVDDPDTLTEEHACWLPAGHAGDEHQCDCGEVFTA